MKISSFEVEQKAFSAYSKVERSQSSIEMFRVNQPQPQEQAIAQSNPQPYNFIELSLSEEGLSLQETKTDELFHLSDEDKAKIQLIEDFVATILGKKFKFKQVVKLDEDARMKSGKKAEGSDNGLHLGHNVANRGRAVSQAQQGALGIRITQSHEIQESEKMSFSSKGVVKTADGQTIAFKVNLEMERTYSEKSDVLIEIGAKMQDPLVINFDGKGIAFGEDSLELDITMDGTPEQFRNLAAGSGFLAIDKNQNGNIDDGTELFGPETGSGFGELSTYDSDNNGWIDESDEVFTSLKIWTVNPSGEKSLIGLKEADVGAIYLGKVASEYQMKSGADLLAKIRESSVYLKENGGAGTIHEIDLKI